MCEAQDTPCRAFAQSALKLIAAHAEFIFRPAFLPHTLYQETNMPNHAHSFLLAFGALACLSASGAKADPNYRCTITQRVTAAAESPAIQKAQDKAHIGRQFSVDRKTGVMTGSLMNAYAVEPQVIDSGSAEGAYKVVTTIRQDEGAGFGSAIYALTINEQEETEQKPFVFLENDKVYLGRCVHF